MDRIQKYLARNATRFLCSFGVYALLSVSACCWADNNAPPAQAQADRDRAMLMRSGGILNESFDYHHPQPMRSAIELGAIPQANGWYEYGFPMQSYRWGWFGAERHFPQVTWHQGYYGESMRASMRSAY
jgi:hypothetical protein